MNEELNQELEIDEVEGKEFYSQDEVLDIIDQITPKIEIDNEELNGLKLDLKVFKDGLKDISFACGQYVGLMSVGVSAVDAFQYILNESTGKSNKDVTKVQQINVESNQI
jgi:hypothetical protein